MQDDPKLWYGIGILYDRYGSLEHAEEAFCAVLQMDKSASISQRFSHVLLTQFANRL